METVCGHHALCSGDLNLGRPKKKQREREGIKWVQVWEVLGDFMSFQHYDIHGRTTAYIFQKRKKKKNFKLDPINNNLGKIFLVQ